MIEISRLEDVLTEHPELPRASKVWLSNFALQLMPGFSPVEVRTAEDLNDYVSGRNYAPCPRLGAMIIAAMNLDGSDPLDRWLAVTEVVTEADQDSLRHIAHVCGEALAVYNHRRNHPASGVDGSGEAGAALIAFIWHVALEVCDLDEARRLIEEVFPTESPLPPLD